MGKTGEAQTQMLVAAELCLVEDLVLAEGPRRMREYEKERPGKEGRCPRESLGRVPVLSRRSWRVAPGCQAPFWVVAEQG